MTTPASQTLPQSGFPVITAQEVGELLGLDDRTLRKRMSRKTDPLPVLQRSAGGRGKQSLFDARQVFAWGIREALRTGDEGNVLNLDGERARLAGAQADAHELKVAELQGALLRREDIEREAALVFAQVRTLLTSLPMQLRRHEPDMSSASAQRIDETVSRCLNSIAEFEVEDTPPQEGERAAA